MQPTFQCKHGGSCQLIVMRYAPKYDTTYWHCPKCGLHLKQVIVQIPGMVEVDDVRFIGDHQKSKPVMTVGFVIEKEGEANVEK